MKLLLYSTLGCHLCEQALAMIEAILPAGTYVEEIDIISSNELVELYGVRIPVVVRTDDLSEIGWPFNQQQFIQFLS